MEERRRVSWRVKKLYEVTEGRTADGKQKELSFCVAEEKFKEYCVAVPCVVVLLSRFLCF